MKKCNQIVLLLVILFSSCVTKQKMVDISKSEIEVFEDSEIETNSTSNLSIESNYKGFEFSEFAQITEKFNWNFSGQNADDELKIKIDKTESGFEITAKGKGSANAETNSKFEVSQSHLELQSKYDSVLVAFSDYKNKTESRTKKFEKEKTVEKKSVRNPAGYVIIFFLFLAFLVGTFIAFKLRP